MSKKRPYGFIHDITLRYHRFHIIGYWFYPATGYSDEFQQKCWRFDGQFFFKDKS